MFAVDKKDLEKYKGKLIGETKDLLFYDFSYDIMSVLVVSKQNTEDMIYTDKDLCLSKNFNTEDMNKKLLDIVAQCSDKKVIPFFGCM